MVIDVHPHSTGREIAANVIRSLNDAGIDVGALVVTFVSHGYSRGDEVSLRQAN